MWLPKYLVDELGVTLEQSGLMLLLPFLLPFLGCNLGSMLADSLLARGWALGRCVMKSISEFPCSHEVDRRPADQVSRCFLRFQMKQNLRCKRRVRKTMELISSTAICLCVGYFVVVKEPSPAVFTVLFSCSQFFGSFCLSSYSANILDVRSQS